MTTINTGSASGVVLASGSFTNPVSIASSVSITNGGDAVRGNGQAWTVINSGTVASTTADGIHLTQGGRLTQTAAGIISGTVGVALNAQATLAVHGSIVGTGGTAVAFGGNGANLLAVYADAAFTGTVAGGSSATNALKFASSAATGTVSGLGTEFTSFQSIAVASAANWVVTGSNPIGSYATFTDSGTLTNTGTLGGPVTLASGGVMTNASGAVIATNTVVVAGTATNVSLLNAGTIAAGSYGVSFSQGGTVDNTSTGFITGSGGIYGGLGYSTTVTNDGTVAATLGIGVYVTGSAILANGASGIIASATGFGVYIDGSGTVTNHGTIASALGGVVLSGGGTLTNAGTVFSVSTAVLFGGTGSNLLIVDPGAEFDGAVRGSASAASNAMELAAGSGDAIITALGTSFAGFSTIVVDPGAYWTFAGSGSVASASTLTVSGNLTESGTLTGTVSLAAGGVLATTSAASISSMTHAVVGTGSGVSVSNLGSIVASGGSYAINLQFGGTISNAADATISGSGAIHGAGGVVTLVNGGVVAGLTTSRGVDLTAGGEVTNSAAAVISGDIGGVFIGGGSATVQNAGTISATSTVSGYGLTVSGGGVVTNGTSGLISGLGGICFGDAATLINDGTILATTTTDDGVYGGQGSWISNAAGALISGVGKGVYLDGGGTLINAGTIASAGSLSVYLGGTSGNLLKVDPGAVFVGGVSGTAGIGNVLDLASAASAGTIAGIGTSFVNFATIEVDSGADWVFSSPGSIASATLVNAGTVTGPLTLGAGGTLTNMAGAVVASSADAVTLADASAVVFNGGTIAATSGAGVSLLGGAISNGSTGLIEGSSAGLSASGAGANIGNYGTVVGTGLGVEMLGDSSILTNAGTIVGNGGTAVVLGGGGANELVFAPGGTFSGIVVASTSATNLLYLASGGHGTLAGIGTEFIGFTTIHNDLGSYWLLGGSNTLASGVDLSGHGALYLTDTLVNYGLVSYGLKVKLNGVVTNAAGGLVSEGTAGGIHAIDSGVTVVNDGTIAATTMDGVLLTTDGRLTNHAQGVISGYDEAVFLQGTGVQAVNAGTIQSLGSSGTAGIVFADGGTLTTSGTIIGGSGVAVAFEGIGNGLLVVDPGAVFEGTVNAGISATNTLELAAGGNAGTIGGLGSSFTNFATVVVDAAASWTLTGDNAPGTSATVSDFGALTNAGTLHATVTLQAGGSVTNAAGATIATTGNAVFSTLDNVGLVNGGVLASSGEYGVLLGGVGAGSVSVTNQTGAIISGTGGVQLGTASTQMLTAATVVNYGTIAATSGSGVAIFADGTLVDGGTIIGTNGTAAFLGGVDANLLVLHPGAVLTGVVEGYFFGTNTMELASGGQGTVSGLGVSFENFGLVTIDSSAYWTVEGSNTIAPADTFSVDGVLTNAGTITGVVTLAYDGTVTNASGGTITGVTKAILGTGPSASVVNAGTVVAAKGITLAAGGQVTNQSTGLVQGTSGDGVVAAGNAYVLNAGAITATHIGVKLVSAGTVMNASTGLISGQADGVAISGGAATLVNAGTIVATGQGGDGVLFDNGGTVDNAYGASISGGLVGVYFNDIFNDDTLTNAGTIVGGGGNAVLLDGPVNRLVLQPGAVFEGLAVGALTSTNAMELGTRASDLTTGPTQGTVSGLGIAFVDFGSIEVDAGAGWTATGFNTIGSSVLLTEYGSLDVAGTLTNDGTIVSGDTLHSAITVSGNGTLTNDRTIAGGVSLVGALLVNTASGTVSGYSFGVYGSNDGTSAVVNYGRITGTADGVYLADGGFVFNHADALIDGSNAGVAISGGVGTVFNAGTLIDSTVAGLALNQGGFAINVASGLIAGQTGFKASGAAAFLANAGTVVGSVAAGAFLGMGGTVLNAGTISGANGTAVGFHGSLSSRLIVDPGAVFVGAAVGSTDDGARNALELASAASAGTLSGIGTSFTNFGLAEVDAGASWTLSGSNSMASDTTLADFGSLVNTGTLLAKVTIETGGYLGNVAAATIAGSGIAVLGEAAGLGLVNHGTIVALGTVSGDYGVTLAAGGMITNATGALITGGVSSVRIAGGSGTVDNAGTISGLYAAIQLTDGGQVTNAASASISGGFGVLIQGGVGTVTNAGTIMSPDHYGVGLYLGGAVLNTLGGRITAAKDAVSIYEGLGTVVNSGTLAAGIDGVYAGHGAWVTNASGAAIYGASYGLYLLGADATVFNSGSIGGSNEAGIAIKSSITGGGGALVVNEAGASISGFWDGIYVASGLATVVNAGTIASTGTPTNEAVVYGVELDAGGSVTNIESGRITGYTGIYLGSGASTLRNDGTIVGTSLGGLAATGAAVVVNTVGALIKGQTTGISQAGGTLTNAGTIVGIAGTAVAFTGTASAMLVVDPGAVFSGVVSAGTASARTMELASAASAGTLDGLGTNYANFGTVTVDAGARWELDGTENTLAASSTLTNAGTLTLRDAFLGDSGGVVNNGLIVLDPSRLDVGSLTGTGLIDLAASGTLEVSGQVSAGQTLEFDGGENAFLILDDAPDAGGTIGGFGVGDTIDLTDLAFVGGQTVASVLGNVLTATNGTLTFTFPTAALADGTPLYTLDDGNGGTDITVTPPVPSAIALAAASDSGVQGDELTNVALPSITGHATPFGTIDLYLGGVLVGVGTADGTGAWSVATTVALTEGTNTFTSTVTDTIGHLSAVSPPLVVTLDTTAPAAPSGLLLAPSSDSNVVGDDITNVPLPMVTGTASPYSTIDLYDGTTLVGFGTADGGGAWSVTATASLTPGVNVLTAHALDAAGNDSEASATLDVTYLAAAVPPTALALAPSSDSGVAGDRLTNQSLPAITGTGTPGNTIDLYDGGVLVGTGTVGVDGQWSANVGTPLAEGANTLTAQAIDAAGNTSDPSSALVVTLDTSVPASPGGLALAAASDGGIKGDDLTNVNDPAVTGTGTPGDTVTLYEGEVAIGTGTVSSDGTWSVTPTSALSDGTHVLGARQTNPAGTVSTLSPSLTLGIDTAVPPSPGTLMLAPASDTGVAGDGRTSVTRPTVLGLGTPDDVVTLYDDGSVVGTATVTVDGTWSIVPTAALSEGAHPLSARVTSPAGNLSAPSTTLPLTIDTTAPSAPTLAQTATVTDPAKPSLVGTAEAGATVTIYDGATALGSAVADGAGTYTFVVPAALGSGTHTLKALAADAAGNLSPASAPLTINVATDDSYAIVSPPDDSGTTVARVYSNAGTLTAANTYDGGGLLLQHVSADVTTRNIYDSDGTLIGIVSGPGSADGTPPQPDFATGRLVKGAQTATDSGASVVTLLAESNNLSTKGDDTVFAGSGSTTVSANANAVLVAGGTGSLVFTGGSSASTVLGGAGSSVVFGGTGGGIFQGGSGGRNVLVAGDGNATLLGGGAGDLLLGAGGGDHLIMGNAAQQTLVGGGGAATLVGGGQGGSELFGGGGTAAIFAGSGGADTIVSGSGSAVVSARYGDVVFASQGTASVFGSATGNDVMVGGGTVLMVGGNGNDVYAGGGGASTVFSGAGNDTLFTGSGTMLAVLGAGNDEVFLGSGAATVFAGSGKDIFATFAGASGGRTVIAGFKAGTDLIGLGGYDLTTVKQQSNNGATTLTLSDNTQITLLGINHLAASSIF